jgi:hypothetical protein
LGSYRAEIVARSFRKTLARMLARAFGCGERCPKPAEDARIGGVMGIAVFPADGTSPARGGIMIGKLAVVTVLAYSWIAPAAKAGGTIAVRCGANEDRVWVYESIVDFNVETKLKCGDQVEVIDRVKGYVKVRTASGDEGFVLASAFPKSAIPPEPEDKSNDLQSASQKMLTSSKTRTETASSATVSAKPATPVLHSVAAAPPAAATAPAVAAVSGLAPNKPASSVAVNSAPHPSPTLTSSNYASAVAPAVANAAPASAKPAAAIATPAPTISIAESKAPAAAAPQPTVAAARVTVQPAGSLPTPEVNGGGTMEISMTSETPSPAPAPVHTTQPVAPPVDPDTEEYAPTSALSIDTANCTTYFTAYGLSPNQYKWLAQNRGKAFPSVCPAPSPSMVDYVIIFTHDVGFYSVTLPTPIHKDLNGFSDWTPISTVDSALINDVNHSHHEYVWIFHSKRGTFDPSAFSPRRKPLFSKSETNTLGSHGGFRTVMDGLTYIESSGQTPQISR